MSAKDELFMGLWQKFVAEPPTDEDYYDVTWGIHVHYDAERDESYEVTPERIEVLDGEGGFDEGQVRCARAFGEAIGLEPIFLYTSGGPWAVRFKFDKELPKEFPKMINNSLNGVGIHFVPTVEDMMAGWYR